MPDAEAITIAELQERRRIIRERFAKRSRKGGSDSPSTGPEKDPVATLVSKTAEPSATKVTREQLIENLNEDLAREYQAIIAYVVYSQVLKGAQYMNIADQLQQHAQEELKHALTISRQIDYLGAMPTVQAKPVKVSDNAKEMLRFDLQNEVDTIRNYRERVRQCEAMGEFAMAEHIREILLDEQDHLIDLATALGEDVPDLSKS